MDCAECERLRVERELRKRACELANLNLSAAATSADRGQFMILKTLADEAKVDLDLVDAEIMQHRTGHTKPAS
jgi:hypothetical protein